MLLSGNDSFPPTPTPIGPRAGCEPWPETRHALLQAAHFLFSAAFAVPAGKRPVAQFAARVFLSAGFLTAGAWAALRSCAGPDVLAWDATLLLANFAQAAYIAYRSLPPRIAPELQELYLKVFHPLKVSRAQFRVLVRPAHMEPLEAGEHYALEGVTGTDQRLAVLISGKIKVTCEDILLHFLSPTEFVDSPEWESCTTNTDKHFQVTLTATEPCHVLCWGRKELLSLLDANPFLNVVLYHLIGRDITHKLYSLSEHHRQESLPKDEARRPSITDSLEFWRNPDGDTERGRSHSVDDVNTEGKGHVRSLFWIKPERRDRRTSAAEQLNDSRTSNFSDPGPFPNQRKTPMVAPHFPSETPV